MLSFRKQKRQPQLSKLDFELGLQEEEQKLSPQAELLYQIIQQLPTADKSIIMAHLDGYNNEEIGEILGITKNNVAVKLHRIKQNIQEKIKTKKHGNRQIMG